MLKNQRASLYVSLTATACALAALILFAVTNATVGYGIKGSAAAIACTLISLVLCAASVLLQRKDVSELLISALRIAALMLIMAALGVTLEDRAVVAGGLFTWNSMDTYAWHAFYTGIACIAFQAITAILLTVSGFLKQGTK